MKIGIDIRSTLKRTMTGIGKYTFNLINALAEIDRENNYYLYSRKKILDFRKSLPRLPAGNFFHRVDYFKRGPNAILPEIDIYHTSSYDLERPKKAKYIVTIHDVIIKAYPFCHSKQTIEKIDKQLESILDEADILIAYSYNTKSDLMRFYGVAESRIVVIYPGVSGTFRFHSQPGFLRRSWLKNHIRKLASKSYILFAGTLEPRKNVQGIIKAFSWLKKEYGIKERLYIAGMKGWMYECIFKAYEDSEFKKDIYFLGYMDEERLQILYKGASVLVYPSFYEGFGFPIIEAFSFGVPVVTSKTSSCGEIAQDCALLIDPNNYREIGEAILKLINDGNLREELSQKGINKAREFIWTKTASEVLKLFTQGGI